YDSRRKMGKLSIFAASRIVIRYLLAIAVLIPGAIARADSEAQFAAAAEQYQQGQWQEAADGFVAIVETNPNFARAADAHFFAGEALVQLQKWQDARAHFEAVATIDPAGMHAVQSQFRSGEAAFMLGDDQAALPQLAAFVR